MNVADLAEQLGVSEAEAIAVCTASGISVSGGSTRLTSAEVTRIRDVLSGKIPMVDPRAAQRTGGGLPRGVVVAGAVVLGLVLLVVVATTGSNVIGGGSTDINVRAGQCFDADLLTGTVFGTGIDPKPCGDAAFRAYAVIDLDEVFDEWPGEEAISTRGEERCGVLADGRVESEGMFIEYYAFGPSTETAWDNEASHKIVCAERT